MIPTLKPGQLIYARKIDPTKIERLQIIVFNFKEKKLIKRVFGLPGDHVQIDDTIIKVNHKKLTEMKSTYPQSYEWQLNENEFCLLGDNPLNSLDSRRIGLIPSSEILYRVRARLWPPKLF